MSADDMGNVTAEKKSGCGFLTAIFGRKNRPRKVTSSSGNSNDLIRRIPSTPNSSSSSNSQKQGDRTILRPGPNHYRSSNYHQQQALEVYNKNQAKKNVGSSTNYDEMSVVARSAQVYGVSRKLPYGTTGISGELESMIQDHQKSTRAGPLVRASSSNIMLYGNLGNLRQGGGGGGNVINEEQSTPVPTPPNGSHTGRYATSVMGNVVIKKLQNDQEVKNLNPNPNPVVGPLCRALSTRMDPEELKMLGNEDYKNGRFAEALALYEAAISIDPNKASYRSNKSAALTALGRLLEAVFECKEAIQIEPHYQRAHSRLATLYLRLGDGEKAMYHYKHAGIEADPDDVIKGKKIQGHLNKCNEAKMHRDWHTLLKETTLAISAGADSAPQIFGLKAETLLKLQRHEDAEETMQNSPKFSDDECIKFFGPSAYAALKVIRAQVDVAAGRFDEAVEAAQLAARLDPNNKEAKLTIRKTRAMAAARSNGNELFKTGKYSEACIAYGEGLNYDPINAVLLCNRAACRSKLGQNEKALDDCNNALNIRPSYKKARLRRGVCYFMLEKWEACIKECEILLNEPGEEEDEEVKKLLEDARTKLYTNNERHELSVKQITGNIGDQIVVVSTNQRFRDYVTSKGLSVVLFHKKPWDKEIMQFMEQLHGRYSSVNFLKVEVEDVPSIARSEGVNPRKLPVFKVYKNGSRTRDIPATNYELLESTIQLYIS